MDAPSIVDRKLLNSTYKAWLPLVFVLTLWNAVQLSRINGAMKMGHEAWIGRQIGRTARNHVVLGLATTKGATVTAIRQDGSLELHRSYTPLASWTVALPMAMGLPYHLSIRLVVLISLNIFFLTFWIFVKGRWGDVVAGFAIIYSGLAPVLLFRHGMSCIFEILALGPLMGSVALFSQPRRGILTWSLLALLSSMAVMYSWICWIVILPCAFREIFHGRRLGGVVVMAASIVVPVMIHVLVNGLASGTPVADVTALMNHILVRASGTNMLSGQSISYATIVWLLFERWASGLGRVSLLLSVGGLVLLASRRIRPTGTRWLWVFFAFALPMNLSRNIAFLHDFFIILFVPLAAIASALATEGLARAAGSGRRGVSVAIAVLVLFLVMDVWSKRKLARPVGRDIRQESIANTLGRVVRPGDLVIVNPEVCGSPLRLHNPPREQIPRSYYAGELAQTVFLAYDVAEVATIAQQARPGQRVLCVQIDPPLWIPPAGFIPITTFDEKALRIDAIVTAVRTTASPRTTIR